MKYYFVLFFALFFAQAPAQNKEYLKEINQLTQKAYQFIYTNKDSSYYYIEKVFLLAKKNNDWESVFTILSASNRSASYFYDLGRMNKNIIQLDSLYQFHEKEIDRINILNASILGMHKSIQQLTKQPGFIAIGGNKFKPYNEIPYECVIKGNGKYLILLQLLF